MTDDVRAQCEATIVDLLIRQRALREHLAEMSIAPNGDPWCCVCNTTDGVLAGGGGLGGVYACRECSP